MAADTAHLAVLKQQIKRYIKAKDQNRPHLLRDVFTVDATLEMKVDSENISFPATTLGCEAIADVLVRQFSGKFENVYTLCTTDSITVQESQLMCNWYVFMTDKSDGRLRIGYGVYYWTFDNSSELVKHLTIKIDAMQIFDEEESSKLFAALNQLDDSWLTHQQLMLLLDKFSRYEAITEVIKEKG